VVHILPCILMEMGSSLQVAHVLIKYRSRCRVADPDPIPIFRIRLATHEMLRGDDVGRYIASTSDE
jgi:hypothetical protein